MDQETLDRAREMAQVAQGGQADLFMKDIPDPMNPAANPAERPGRERAEMQRTPMSVPVQRLAVPEIPGWHLHWFRGTPDRILRAQQAGYQFVSMEEVNLNSLSLGSDSAVSGNQDLGSRVTVASGSELTADNQPMQMVLMKLREEHWRADCRILEDRNEQIADAIRGGKIGAGQAGGENMRDQALRYTSKESKNLFTRKPQGGRNG